MPKCICQICQCGKHRCPHYMPQPTRKKSKGPCEYSEYQTMYKQNQNASRDPIHKPGDVLRNEGDVDYNTTNKEKFPAHEIKRRHAPRAQEHYVRNPAPMELDTEYGTKYVKGRGETIPLPDYWKQKSQPYGDGKDRFGKSTTHKDFQQLQPGEKVPAYRMQDNVHLPDDPFDHRTTNQTDYTKMQTLPEKSQKRQDQLESNGPGTYQTTSKEHFVQHKNSRRYQKPPAAVYHPDQRPFEGKSMTKSDYQPHSFNKSEMVRYENQLFVSDQPLDKETTNLATYKGWEVQKRQALHEAPVYKKPPGKMDFNKTSDDYKLHGSVNSKTTRPRDNLEWMDQGFESATSYKDGYIKHDAYIPEKSMAHQREYVASGVPFDAVTENKDKFKRMNVAPSKPIRRDTTGLIDKEAPFVSDTSYDAHFNEKKLPECPSTKLVANNFAGYKVKDDFVGGHRYLVPDSRVASPSNHAPLPPIGQSNQQRYVAVQ